MKQSHQFVVQKHITTNDIHWDLMIKYEDVLWTWRCPIGPDQIGQESIELEKIFDHSLRFLTYEGPVQQNTGNVQIADSGNCKIISQIESAIQVEFSGSHLRGLYLLEKKNDPFWTILSNRDITLLGQ